jgi:hypothetical protein
VLGFTRLFMSALDAGIPFVEAATMPTNMVVMALLAKLPRGKTSKHGGDTDGVRDATQQDIDWLTH